MVNDGFGVGAHVHGYAIIATHAQVETCDNRLCIDHANIAKCVMDLDKLKALMEARGMRQIDLVAALGIDQDKVSKVFNHKRKWQPDELLKLLALFNDHEDSTNLCYSRERTRGLAGVV